MINRIFTPFVLFALTGVSAAVSAEAPNDRLRDRLPSPRADRPVAPVAVPDDAAAPDSTSNAVLASPRQIILDGAVAISHDAFEPVLARYVGRALTQKDLAALARDVTDRYRSDGYFLSRAVVPPQTVSNGVLRIKIEEGRYTDVVFDGSTGDAFRPYFESLLMEIPARRATLERALMILSELGGARVKSSKTVPVDGARGTYRLVLSIETSAADGTIYVDNRGEGGGDAIQLSAQTGFNGIGTAGGRLEVSVFTDATDPGRRQYFEASYSAPVGLRGTIATLSASASNTTEGAFGWGRYQSQGTDLTLGVRHPVFLTRAHAIWASAEVTQSNSDANIEGLGLRRDELTFVRAGVSWDGRDSWGERNRVSLSATIGRDGFQAPSPLHPMARRDDGATFSKFTLQASRTQRLSPTWSVFAALRGQYSVDDLPDDEEISFGGARWARAYDYGEIDGDSGAAGQIELRYTIDAGAPVTSLQAYAFGDAAATWVRAGEGEPETLSSAGLGLRASFGDGYRAGVEAAVPLDRLPPGRENRNPRIFATFAKEF